MPTLETGYWFGYWRDTRDPTATEAVPPMLVNVPNFLEIWWNQSSGEVFFCPDNTQDAMVWQKNITDANLSDALTSIGLNINTNRSYTTRSTPAFATNYTPSTTNDTFVVANISQTSVLLGSAAVNAVIGGVTIANASLSGVAATQTNSLSFIVPANSTYQITQSATGVGASNSILSIRELSL